MQRRIPDGDVYLGWFHSEDSLVDNGSRQQPRNFLGAIIGGTTASGPTLSVAYGLDGIGQAEARDDGPPLYPYDVSRNWMIEYDPSLGSITITVDGQSYSRELMTEAMASNTHFNRFGLITSVRDGLYSIVYLDNVTYTYGHRLPSLTQANDEWQLYE